MNENFSRRIASPLLLDAQNSQWIKNPVVELDAQGNILSIDQKNGVDSLRNTEYYNGILMPGMTNAHCHLELSYFKGAIEQGTGLVDFVRYVVSHRNDYTVAERLNALRVQDKMMWSQGTQAVGDISNDPFSFQDKADSPIYYYTFMEYFGTPSDSESQAVYDRFTTEGLAEAKRVGIDISPSPHSTYLVNDALFKMAAHSQRVSIHFMESTSELDLFAKHGGMYDYMVSGGMVPDFLSYGGHAERLVESLPADLPLLLVHNTNIRRQDVELICNHFRDVTFVLCPRSNYYIERSFPPAKMLHEMGCRIALGTDSLSSNTSLSIASEVEWLWRTNPELPLEVILGWATLGGAQALGQSSHLQGLVLLEGVDLAKMALGKQPLTCRRLV